MYLFRAQRIFRILPYFVLAPSLVLGSAIVVLAVLLADEGSVLMNELVEKEDQLRALQQEEPLATFLIASMAYFVPGTNGKAFLVGWLFGAVSGAILINTASILAAMVMFYAARHLLRDHIESRYAGHLAGIHRNVECHGGAYLLALRAVPLVPYSIVNGLMGVTKLRRRTFWWASQLGMLPSNLAFAWVGASLPELQAVRENGWIELLSLELIGATILAGTLPLATRYVFRLWRRQRMVGIEA